MIFSIFRFFCTLRFQIFKYCPNHTSMKMLLFSDQMKHTSQFRKMCPYDWFCAPGSRILMQCSAYWLINMKEVSSGLEQPFSPQQVISVPALKSHWNANAGIEMHESWRFGAGLIPDPTNRCHGPLKQPSITHRGCWCGAQGWRVFNMLTTPCVLTLLLCELVQ